MGIRIVYLSLDHRSARWSALGIAQGNARVGVQSGLAEQQLMTLRDQAASYYALRMRYSCWQQVYDCYASTSPASLVIAPGAPG